MRHILLGVREGQAAGLLESWDFGRRRWRDLPERCFSNRLSPSHIGRRSSSCRILGLVSETGFAICRRSHRRDGFGELKLIFAQLHFHVWSTNRDLASMPNGETCRGARSGMWTCSISLRLADAEWMSCGLIAEVDCGSRVREVSTRREATSGREDGGLI
jgi:hypothetical protein